MNWFTRKDKNIQNSAKKELPSDLWKKCNCGEILYSPELESANFICHHCSFHFPISSQKYIDIILDDEYEVLFENIVFNSIYDYGCVPSFLWINHFLLFAHFIINTWYYNTAWTDFL